MVLMIHYHGLIVGMRDDTEGLTSSIKRRINQVVLLSKESEPNKILLTHSHSYIITIVENYPTSTVPKHTLYRFCLHMSLIMTYISVCRSAQVPMSIGTMYQDKNIIITFLESIIGLCDGLMNLHESGSYHGNIHPKNIMVLPNGNNIKLCWVDIKDYSLETIMYDLRMKHYINYKTKYTFSEMISMELIAMYIHLL